MACLTDVESVVIGAGIMGVSAAFYLGVLGQDVVLLDRKAVGDEASGRNAGSLSLQNKPYPIVPLCKAGIDTWEELEREIGGLGFVQSGGFRVAETADQAKYLDSDLVERNRYGLGIRRLAPSEVRAMAPYLAKNLAAVNYCTWDSYVDARVATQRIALGAASRGVRIVAQTPATGIGIEQGHRILVHTSNGTYRCRRLLVTAGIWTKDIAQWLGISLPINLRINQMIVTPRLPHFIHHMITHAAGNLTLKQVDCGSVLVGGGWPGDGDLAANVKRPRYMSVIGNAQAAVRVVPELANVEAIRTWAGFDGRTEDQLPILGALPGHNNLFVASSCFGGYVAGPFIGKLMAQAMSGEVPEMSLDAFSPRRYESGEAERVKETTC